MKFTCTRENLLYGLDIVTPLTGKNNHLPILSHIHINAQESHVDLIGTNLEVAVKVTIRAKVDAVGSFTVPAKTLNDYIRLLSGGQIEIAKEENELVILCGSSKTKIKGMPSDDYPVIPPAPEQHGYAILSEPLKEALTKTIIAVAKNEIRPELSGVSFAFCAERYSNGLILAATDSYRLAEKKLSISQGGDAMACIVPARAVSEMIRLLGLARKEENETLARLSVSEHQIALRYDSFEMTARLIDGNYPDYAQIIPTQFKTTATFPADVMIREIRAASLFTNSIANAVSFDLNASESTIGISSTSNQMGEHSSTVDAEVKGEENSILLNYRYVIEGLQQMDDENISFNVNSADTPCLFQAQNHVDYLYIVMPVRQ